MSACAWVAHRQGRVMSDRGELRRLAQLASRSEKAWAKHAAQIAAVKKVIAVTEANIDDHVAHCAECQA